MRFYRFTIHPLPYIVLPVLLTLSGCALVSEAEKNSFPQARKHAPYSPENSAANPLSQDTNRKVSPRPDAVFFLPLPLKSGHKNIPADAQKTLRQTLDNLRGERNVLFVLEAWLPVSGSQEISLSMARQAAQAIKEQLVNLNVRSYRVKTQVRGNVEINHSSPENDRLRVDLFLLRLPR
ncbi:MAG: hypothetical protein LBG69_05525 [Zoogloeaceae bacterium]|jgi:hypothetical protein|nr:hypothetical protein [Zoogloeaceae bacterium]